MFTFYKILFPECCCLYAGITGVGSNRYGPKNQLGGRFYGPHKNPEIQYLLDQGFFAIWIPVKETVSETEVRSVEKNYLNKIWRSGELKDRPLWLLNRRNGSTGWKVGRKRGPNFLIRGVLHYTKKEWDPDTHWTKQPENKTKVERVLLAANSNEAIQKRKETRQATQSNPDYVSPLVGRKRPQHSELMKQKTKCPFCDLLSNPGGLATHVKTKHKTEQNNALH
jgi:hypothetical protein